jgi:tetratricopeptide (TPR) repeat protein
MIRLKYLLIYLLISLQASFACAQQKDDVQPATTTHIDQLLDRIETLRTSHTDSALLLALHTLELSQKIKYQNGEVATMNYLAEIYWEKTDLKTALDFADKAKAKAQKLNDKTAYADALLIIGKIYTDLGDYNKSADLNYEALRIFDKLKNREGTSRALNRIGYVYFEQGNFPKALEYYTQSLQIAREIDNQAGIARGLNNIAACHGIMGNLEQCELYIRQALTISSRLEQKLMIGINYLNLGLLLQDSKNYDSAFIYLQKAATIFTEQNNIPKLTSVYLSLSEYFKERKEFQKALDYANMAWEEGARHKLKKTKYEAAGQLHAIYLLQDDLVDAYKYSTLQYQMKDSLEIERSMTRLSQLEMMYDFEKQQNAEKLSQQAREFTLILLLTILISLSGLAIVAIVARNRIRAKNAIILQKQLENDIDSKNKELTANVMALMRKNETLADIAGKLMEIRDEAVKEETKFAIKKIAGDLQKTTDDEIWKEFEVRFMQVHHDFYQKLISRFPNLTPTEQRLCAFLRLNMTSKEISELTGQRTGTLEIARSRLRKKLGIANTQANLVTFLSKI